MSENKKHARLPYFIISNQQMKDLHDIVFCDDANEPITLARGLIYDDVEFIIRACNSHYELLELLHQCYEYIEGDGDAEIGIYGQVIPNTAMRLRHEIEEAIAKAEAK